MKSDNTSCQVTGAYIEQCLLALKKAKANYLQAVERGENFLIGRERLRLEAALNEVEKLRDFIQNPLHILGPDRTKHGEIAEQLEVRIHNARQLLRGKKPTGVIDCSIIPRTGPVDFILNDFLVQSKFCNSARITLDAVREHLSKYPDFAYKNCIYCVPKDQYSIYLEALRDGSVEGMRGTSLLNLKNKILQMEKDTGRTFQDLVRPSISEYPEVQLNEVAKTIGKHEDSLRESAQSSIDKIRKDADKKREHGSHITDPTWSEAVKVAAVGAAISGTFQGAIVLYQKLREGKKMSDFTEKDWEDIGINAGKGALQGGGSGFAIYGLTRVLKCPSALSSALVAASFGIYSNFVEYKKGHLTQSEFIDASYATCFESALGCAGVALCSLAMTPVAGAIVGTIVTQFVLSSVKKLSDDEALIKQMQAGLEEYKAEVEREIEIKLKPVADYYTCFDLLVQHISNQNIELRKQASIGLCRLTGVKEEEIPVSIPDLDRMFQ